MQLLLKSIDHCNISLSTITPMLQQTGMEIVEHSSQCRISYAISGTLKISDTRYLIFLKIVRYEPNTDTDTNTNTNIITALVFTTQP